MVLVINSGSSSIKCSLFEGERLSRHIFKEEIKNYHKVLEEILKTITFASLQMVVHRVVHGGREFTEPTRIDEKNIDRLKQLSSLAPLHNPANIEAIEYFLHNHPKIPQIAVFDTAFFADMDEAASLYAIDRDLSNRYHIRRYGFHGNSYSYLLHEAAKLLEKDVHRTSLITLHIGNGASICAIQNGKSIDTSMGFTPLEGLVMGSRSGDIDPGVVLYMLEEIGMDKSEVGEVLNKRSGLKGLCGTNDVREILKRSDEAAVSAMRIYTRRIKKYIGAYLALLEDVDGIVFSGGVGENAPKIRKMVLRGLEKFGIMTDFAKNERNDVIISKKESPIKVFVIRTNEELEMLRRAKEVV